jgi:MoaA/NifB/PqqE/SkfB family radical SAM enzyme
MRSSTIERGERNEVIQPGTDTYINNLTAVDVIVTQRCPQDCDFCWEIAPRSENGRMQLAETSDLPQKWDADPAQLDAFIGANKGYPGLRSSVNKFIFSGGEPGIYAPLAGRMEVVRNAGMSAVVSTAGMSPKRFGQIAPFANRLEVAIDGPPEVHERSRRGNRLFGTTHIFERALDTLLRAQHAAIPIGIRTLVNSDTIASVPAIPAVLAEHGVRITSAVRIKLYQEAPIGPRAAGILAANKSVTTEALLQAALRLRQNNEKVSICVAPWRQSTQRGAYVQPNGDAYTTAINATSGLPGRIPLGNVYAGAEPFSLAGRFRELTWEHAAYLLMDRQTRMPFKLDDWTAKAYQGRIDDWLAMDIPAPITYEQVISSVSVAHKRPAYLDTLDP